MPAGIVVLGIVLGSLAALGSVGLVLVWRTQGVLNLAHGTMSLVPASILAALVARAGWPYWVALAAAAGCGAAIGLVAEAMFSGRMARAGTAVQMAASLGLAFVLGSIHAAITFSAGAVPAAVPPFDISVVVAGTRLGAAHLVAPPVAALCLVATVLFMRSTRLGLVARAAAENRGAARALGTDVRAASRAVWVIAGLLAAVGGVLAAPILGPSLSGGPATGALLLALAPAAATGMRSLPAAVVAALGVGIAYQAAIFASPRATYAQLLLLAVIAAGAAVMKRSRGRRRRDEAVFAPLTRAGTVWPALAVAAAALVPLGLGPSDANRWATAATWAIGAAGAALVCGLTGRISLGHWAVAGVATAVVAAAGATDLVAALPLGAAAGAATGLALAIPSLRGGRIGYAATTLAAAVALPGALVTFGAFDLGAPLSLPTFAGVQVGSMQSLAAICVATASVAVWCGRRLRCSAAGRRMIAVRDDPDVAAAHGISRAVALLSADAAAGAIAGVAGALSLFVQRLPHADAFAPERSMWIMAAVVIGGMGSVAGAVAATGMLAAAALFLPGSWALLGTGAGVLAVLLIRPEGLRSIAVRRTAWLRHDSIAIPPPSARWTPAQPADTRAAAAVPAVRDAGAAAFGAGALVAAGAWEAAHFATAPSGRPWLVVLVLACTAVSIAAGRRWGFGHAAAAVAVASTGAAWLLAAGSDLVAVANAAVPAGVMIGFVLGRAAAAVPPSLRPAAAGRLVVAGGGGALVAIAVQATHADTVPAGWFTLFAVVGALFVLRSSARRALPGTSASSRDGAALDVSGLAAGYDGRDVLHHVGLSLRPGEIVALAGGNGSGKTTLLRCLAGLQPPTAGAIHVAGVDATMFGPEQMARLGVCLIDGTQPVFTSMSLAENLRLITGYDDVRRAASDLGFPPGRLPDPASTLSGGERRLLSLARLTSSTPRVLLIDEIGAGLSPAGFAAFSRLVRAASARGAAVLAVEHGRVLEGTAQRRVVLSGGTIDESSPQLAGAPR